MFKLCSKCKISYPLEYFSKDKNRKDGRYHRCKNCSREDQLKYRGKYTDTEQRARKYGTTEAELVIILKQQNYTCPLCGLRLLENWVVDHCHDSGKVRGLLHNRCNISLGFFERNINPNLAKYSKYVGNT